MSNRPELVWTISTSGIARNPDIAVLDNLIAAGINAFDVASLEEIRMVRARAPQASLHYHNPVRSEREISGALRSGVRSFSIDRMSELEKLAQMAQGRPLEVSVRLKLPVKGAAYDFGTKFGATPDEAVELLQRVRDLGFTPSMTFHPGTQCKLAPSPNAALSPECRRRISKPSQRTPS